MLAPGAALHNAASCELIGPKLMQEFDCVSLERSLGLVELCLYNAGL